MPSWPNSVWSTTSSPGKEARTGSPPDADHRRDHPSKKQRPPTHHRRPFRRNQRAVARLLRCRLCLLEEALEIARELGRPTRAVPTRSGRSRLFRAGERCRLTDICWIDGALISARPQAIAALLRYFRDLDTAEEAFQDACLRALKTWPQNGPPRDPTAWLIMVGRNVAIDSVRRRNKQEPLPDDDAAFGSGRRRDGARRAARQRGLSRRSAAAHVHLLSSRFAGHSTDRARLRIVSGLSVQADRARVSGERERDGAAHHPGQAPRRESRCSV